MNKKDIQELEDIEKSLMDFNPELNQSGIYDNEGNKLKKDKIEQFSYIPMGFINSGISLKFPGKKVLAIYHYLSSKCSKWRNTHITNPTIIKDTGLSESTVKEVLRVLEFYHLISRRRYYIRPKRKRRIITLLRWDTAYKMLIKEGKIQANNLNEVYLVMPYKKEVPL